MCPQFTCEVNNMYLYISRGSNSDDYTYVLYADYYLPYSTCC